ncbi:MAG: T9SS type A sorting domain-containing protein [Phycisphaerae bacterium]|nr:T9SS type A sorting domain-containing protein [Saprospiraceae bacterium]
MRNLFQCSRTLLSLLLFLPSLVSAQQLLKNISTKDLTGGFPSHMTRVGTSYAFSAYDILHGHELWKTTSIDQNPSAVLVMDINPNGNSNPSQFCDTGNGFFFTADDGEVGEELWKSNGTAAGTLLVKDVFPGEDDGMIEQLTACNGKLVFVARAVTHLQVGVIDGPKLFVSDGTPQGTFQLGETTVFLPENLTEVGNTVYFSARGQNQNNTELWKTDGTPQGTVMVRNINPGNASSSPANFCNVLGTLYFSADDGQTGRQIWKSNGTTATTWRVSTLSTLGVLGAGIGPIVHLNGRVFFTAGSGVPNLGSQVHRVNAAGNGTVQLAAVLIAENLTPCNGRVFFTQIPQIGGPKLSYVTTNSNAVTDVKTFSIIPGQSSIPKDLTAVGSTLYFTAATAAHGRELWRSTGTEAGTVMVQDFYPGTVSSSVYHLCPAGNSLLFSAAKPDESSELCVYNIGDPSIRTYANIGQSSSFPKSFTPMGSRVYFSAGNFVHGDELWSSDGTEQGTFMLKDIHAGIGSSSPDQLTVITNNGVSILFFVAYDAVTGYELWKSDGTPQGTLRLSNIGPGAVTGNIGNMTNLNGRLYFTGNPGLGTGDRIYRVKTDLSGVETVGGNIPYADHLEANGSVLYFTQIPAIIGPQLCKMQAGVVTVLKSFDLFFGENTGPSNLKVVGSTLYFVGYSAAHGRELWKSNGTSATTTRISNIRPGADNAGIGNLVNFGGQLYFTAFSGTSLGDKIYRVNANATGVEEVATEVYGVKDLEPATGRLYYSQVLQEQTPAIYLCKLEGGIATQIRSFELLAPAAAVAPTKLVAAGGGLFLNMRSSNNGQELWYSNGTSAGTNQVSDIFVGAGNASIREMKVVGDKLYFSAYRIDVGQEPFTYTIPGFLGPQPSEDRAQVLAPTMQLRVGPNPASEWVQVEWAANETNETTVSLLDLSGKVLQEQTAQGGETSVRLDLQGLPAGVYLVQVAQGGQAEVTKLIRQ